MAASINKRMDDVWKSIAAGDPETALWGTRDILADRKAANPIVQLHCAGFLIDAGERLDQEGVVLEGVEILEDLRKRQVFPDGTGDADTLRYNLANGRSAPLHMASRRQGPPDLHVRDMAEHEKVLAIYYESTGLLRRAEPEAVINCAAVLRLEARVYEGIDLLDGVAQRYPEHPNAHMKLAELLWMTARSIRGQDSNLESLLAAAGVHYRRAIDLFEAADETEFAHSCRMGLDSLRQLANRALPGDLNTAIATVGSRRFRTERAGEPVGLGILARSPYRDGDDPSLVDGFDPALREIVTDAVGTFCVGRELLAQAEAMAVKMPRWDKHTPDTSAQLRNAAVRQFWSGIEKVAWLVNEAFQVGLKASECSFAALFRKPPGKLLKANGLPPGTRFYPALDVESAGLRALAGLSCAFDAESDSVYVPLKRLRHTVEHRVPDEPASKDDAAFLLGISRAAILHGVDAVLMK